MKISIVENYIEMKKKKKIVRGNKNTYFVHSSCMKSVNTHLISRKNTIADENLKWFQCDVTKRYSFKDDTVKNIRKITMLAR